MRLWFAGTSSEARKRTEHGWEQLNVLALGIAVLQSIFGPYFLDAKLPLVFGALLAPGGMFGTTIRAFVSWMDRFAIGVMVFNMMRLPRKFPDFEFNMRYSKRPEAPPTPKAA